jgi:hypothetical protein
MRNTADVTGGKPIAVALQILQKLLNVPSEARKLRFVTIYL